MNAIARVTLSNSPPALDAISDINGAQLPGAIEEGVRALLVYEQTTEDAEAVLRTIRQQENPNIYLLPVFVVSSSPGSPEWQRLGFDGFIDSGMPLEAQITTLLARLVGVNQWLQQLPNNAGTLQDVSLQFRVLRLLATRPRSITPLRSTRFNGGYIYPLLEPLLSKNDGGLPGILQFLESQHFIHSEFFTRAHFCPHCQCAFLNFKETCPDCDSENLEAGELLHHFKCGHTDTAEKFQIRNQLQCPKCSELLRHIGVDYDKPAAVYTCNHCNLRFQEPNVQADCFNCGRTSLADNLESRRILSYTISSLGENAARYGLDALFTSILQTDLRLYSRQEMKSFIQVERARIARYGKSEGTVGIINLKNLDSVYGALGKRSEQLFKELSAVFRSVFRDSDIITANNESLFVVLMTETGRESAAQALQRLQDAVHDSFTGSLDFEPIVNISMVDVQEVGDLDESVLATLND